MKQQYYFTRIIAIFVIVVSLFACKKDKDDNNSDNKPAPVPTDKEKIISSKEGIIGSGGGKVILDDSTSVIIVAGELNADAKIVIKKIGNEQIFAKENRNCYEITGIPKGAKATLTFLVPKDLLADYVGVFAYNPTDLSGSLITNQYTASEGKITVSDFIFEKKNKGEEPSYLRWIVEWDTPEINANPGEEKLIPMPYYEQIGGTCWAAATLMQAKAYIPYSDRKTEISIKDFMKDLKIDLNDGLGTFTFMKVLPYVYHSLTKGAGATTMTFWNKRNYIKELVKRLKENKPIVLYLPNYRHGVLAVGYRIPSNATSVDEYEFVLHDPKGTIPQTAKDGGMYSVRTGEWLFKDAYKLDWFLIMYPDAPVHNERSLQTVLLPSYPHQSEISFNALINSKWTLIYLQFDKNKKTGYKWATQTGTEYEVIPSTLNKLTLNLQLYNADLEKPKNLNLQIIIHNKKKDKTTYDKIIPLTLLTDKNKKMYELSLDTNLWLKNFGDTTKIDYNIEIKLTDPANSLYLDGFNLDFTVKGSKVDKYITSFQSKELDNCPINFDKSIKANLQFFINGDKFRTKEIFGPNDLRIYVPKFPNGVKEYNFNVTINYDNITLDTLINPNFKGYDPIVTKTEYILDYISYPLENSSIIEVPIKVTKNNLEFYLRLHIGGKNQTNGSTSSWSVFPDLLHLNFWFDE